MESIIKNQYIKLIVATIVCIACGALFSVLLIRMKTRFDSTNLLRERLVSYQINKKAFNEEAVQMHLLQKRLDSLTRNVISKNSVPDLLSKLEALADASHVKFEITNVQTVLKNDIPRLIVGGAAEGAYSEIEAFFDLLQHQSFQIQFQDLSVYSETIETAVSESPNAPPFNKPKAPNTTKETKWHGVATIEVISFQ